MSKYTENNSVVMEDATESGKILTTEKQDYGKLPLVRNCRVAFASVNSYGRGELAGKMVQKKYTIEVMLKADFGGFKADNWYNANEILVRVGVKTLPYYTDYEKAAKARRTCKKWGREEIVTEKKGKKSSTNKALEEENAKQAARIAELEAKLAAKGE